MVELRKPARRGRLWEDMLTSLYMDYGMEVKNGLMADWFELNLNIGNVLQHLCKKIWSSGCKIYCCNNSVAKLIREHSNSATLALARNWNILIPYCVLLRRMTSTIEKKIDKFRWDWLEENTVFDYFNIEIYLHICANFRLERWVSLNAEEGEKVFRKLINDLKNETKLPEGY